MLSGTEKCLSDCEGHGWQRAAVSAPKSVGTALCYLMVGTVLHCSHTNFTHTAEPMNITTMAARSDGFYLVAGRCTNYIE